MNTKTVAEIFSDEKDQKELLGLLNSRNKAGLSKFLEDRKDILRKRGVLWECLLLVFCDKFKIQ